MYNNNNNNNNDNTLSLIQISFVTVLKLSQTQPDRSEGHGSIFYAVINSCLDYNHMRHTSTTGTSAHFSNVAAVL